ncbi:transglutaminase family protein [Phenylobacterium koreense]|uniref:Transglutaminase-like putative cysteine protease n=1 Tax=Phenylobacterium koreense TaxID=266125 RepID=A0ABV2EMV4_9CAUL
MTRLTIRHETRYTYERPVRFGEHRLLVRPRDSHATRIVQASLAFSPQGQTRWLYDALGNCVCVFCPEGEASELYIVSELVIERFMVPLAPPPIDDPRTTMPLVYRRPDRAVLDPFIDPASDDPEAVLLKWLRVQIGPPDETAQDFVVRLNSVIRAQFDYLARAQEGCQPPPETILKGQGTCRDFAWLMVEALRRLGFAARFVTGYLYASAAETRGAGATHAWCEVFLPGLGWTEFDPTNGLVASPELIPVATSRTPEGASPIRGVIFGDPGTSQLHVSVDVRPADAMQAAAE